MAHTGSFGALSPATICWPVCHGNNTNNDSATVDSLTRTPRRSRWPAIGIGIVVVIAVVMGARHHASSSLHDMMDSDTTSSSDELTMPRSRCAVICVSARLTLAIDDLTHSSKVAR